MTRSSIGCSCGCSSSSSHDEVLEATTFDLPQFADDIFVGAYMPTPAYGFETELAWGFIGISYKSLAGDAAASSFRVYEVSSASLSKSYGREGHIGLVELAACFGGATGALAILGQEEITMTVAAHEAENGTATLARVLRVWLQAMRTAIETHAEYRVKSALPSAKLQQADREIRRYRRLLKTGR